MVTVSETREISPMELCLVLTQRIEEGIYSPGAWLPAERALAEEFAVDRSLVRRALAHLEERGLISRRRGSRPWVTGSRSAAQAPEATALAAPSRTVVAVLPMHPIYPASQAILHGINATLRVKNAACSLQVIDTYGPTHEMVAVHEAEALETLIEQAPSAVFLWQVGGQETVPRLRRLQSRIKALVLVDRQPLGLSSDFVGSDNQGGIDEAIGYLESLGHRKIAFLTTNEDSSAVAQRLEAYRDALTSRRLPSRSSWIFFAPKDDFSKVQPAYDQFTATADRPTAVVAMNDPLANSFISDLEARGVRVPQDMSVIGFDDIDRYAARQPVLTTMRQQFENIGKRAAELALLRMAHTGDTALPCHHILLPTPLIKRATCQEPA
ncbi:MAG: GntR family transcriptional regulator [Capsulimonadaceae bacterium]|nr:GntR family transcriptional regulator [Capsulimonadaceae bacterium]